MVTGVTPDYRPLPCARARERDPYSGVTRVTRVTTPISELSVPRERASEKAVRLLSAGKVTVERADANRALVVVQGDHDRYRVELDQARTSCPCPAWGRCSDERAAWLAARREEAKA